MTNCSSRRARHERSSVSGAAYKALSPLVPLSAPDMSLQVLTRDVLVLVLENLDVKDLAVLSATCRSLHALVRSDCKFFFPRYCVLTHRSSGRGLWLGRLCSLASPYFMEPH